MHFSIKNLLSEAINEGKVDTEYLRLAKSLESGINSRIESEISGQLTHAYQGNALLLKIFAAVTNVLQLGAVQEARRDLANNNESLNARIFDAATKLAKLLREREEKERQANLSPIEPCTLEDWNPSLLCDSVVTLIHRAAELDSDKKHGRYSQTLRPRLAALGSRFDSKYWPDQANLVDAIACFASERRYTPRDGIGLIAEQHRQRCASWDFLRLLEDGLSDIRGVSVGSDAAGAVVFPATFKLTAECEADLLQIFDFAEKTAKEIRQFRSREN